MMKSRDGLSPELHMRQPTDSQELVQLVDSDMLAAEGSPFDLEDDQIYLSGRDLRKTSRSPSLSCSLSNIP